MRLWLKHLQDYPAVLIKAAAERVIMHEHFLPNLAKFREHCAHAFELFGLPDAHSAYMEACRAPQPKSAYKWSHPAVYYAGLSSDWFFLASEPQAKVFPVFKRNYEILCERVMKGEDLKMPVHKALPEKVAHILTPKENIAHLKALRDKVQL